MTLNLLARYYLKLSEAEYALKQVDDFDLQSEIPESCNQFNKLQEESAKQQLNLIDFVVKHSTELKHEINKI
jgi:hypothetical protein